jgi:predicted ATPase with chaperone activity
MDTINIDGLSIEVKLAERMIRNARARKPTLLVSPPGTGKTMMVRRFAVLGPFRAPHHTASKLGLVGQDHGKLAQYAERCEYALAHQGTLFLDEIVEFQRYALDAVRAAYRCDDVKVFDPIRQDKVPSKPWIVGAMNRCGCGYSGSARTCQCTDAALARYARRTEEIVGWFGFDVIWIESKWDQARLSVIREDTYAGLIGTISVA